MIEPSLVWYVGPAVRLCVSLKLILPPAWDAGLIIIITRNFRELHNGFSTGVLGLTVLLMRAPRSNRQRILFQPYNGLFMNYNITTTMPKH